MRRLIPMSVSVASQVPPWGPCFCFGAFGFVCLGCGFVAVCSTPPQNSIKARNLPFCIDLHLCERVDWIGLVLVSVSASTSTLALASEWLGYRAWHLRELVSPTLFCVSAAACAAGSVFVPPLR